MPTKKTTAKRWWTVKYWVSVQEGQPPNYFMNALLVDKVVGPVLSKHLIKVLLYRFHCVFHPENNKGHEWTFWFYSDKSTASSIYKDLKKDELVKRLKSEKLILNVDFDDLRKMVKTEIEDTSDKTPASAWHNFIQETWPYYAKGASECWWRLVSRFAEEVEKELQKQLPKNDPRYLFILYQNVEENIKSHWQSRGQHIFMHHLHAIISWEPVAFQPRFKQELIKF